MPRALGFEQADHGAGRALEVWSGLQRGPDLTMSLVHCQGQSLGLLQNAEDVDVGAGVDLRRGVANALAQSAQGLLGDELTARRLTFPVGHSEQPEVIPAQRHVLGHPGATAGQGVCLSYELEVGGHAEPSMMPALRSAGYSSGGPRACCRGSRPRREDVALARPSADRSGRGDPRGPAWPAPGVARAGLP